MVRASDLLNAMRNFPLTDLGSLLGARPLLVLAPHPDDESLGCGGLIAACGAREHAVHVLVLTDGAASHPRSHQYPAVRLAALRAAEARAALAELGLREDQCAFLGLRDGHAPLRGAGLEQAVACVARHAEARGVGTICTTWQHDPHPDHRAAYRIGARAARAIGARLLCYPVWGWTVPPDAWLPATRARGFRLDIAGYLAAKRRAIACHRSQLTALIADDPGGFRLAPGVRALFDSPFEVFSEP